MWDQFIYISIICVLLWTLSSGLYLTKGYEKYASSITIIGVLGMAYFIISLWMELDRPPLRTLGETRLWYSLFMPIIGLIAYYRWRYSWIIIYSLIMGIVFLMINVMHPENYQKALMPALQSPWFVPHVIVYIFSYALLGGSALIGLKGIFQKYVQHKEINVLYMADNYVYIGFGFLSLGLIFGGLWAKEAWGHYWTWDPKETWALITWLAYLGYIHIRHYLPKHKTFHTLVLSGSFILLLICWFGLNYMSSGLNSVHTYSN
ncbi:cytochrome c biogenesis protein CcsA [Flammeovirga sp. MY04]|uniref:cytochrome c biogenesis protein CcsA n=1 Tax=Flammeovirga sp. MY04 TaxID=1191459 RepID=UPI000806102D|nr:cytochrome c biogenesis protein CcsA [Flammeovirga sp. MY04]ANQ52294.1 cytochrome c biogenesis protein CcsA [Flammeovirga sp. MY04]